MANYLFYVITLFLGFPIGILLAKMCEDEIKSWRRKLIIISFVFLIISLLISFTNFELKFPLIITFFFIVIMYLTIVWKSFK